MLTEEDNDFFEELGLSGEKRHPIKNKEADTIRKEITLRQEIKIKKKRNKKIVITIIILSIIAIGLLCIFTPVIRIHNIKVTGNKKLKTEEIIKISNLKIDKTSVFFFKKNVENNLLKNPYIKNVIIKKDFFYTVNINVTEGKESILFADPEKSIVTDNEGTVIRKTNIKQNLIYIRGFTIKEKNIGEKIETTNKSGLNNILKLISLFRKNKIKIKEIEYGDAVSKIYIRDNFYIEGRLSEMIKNAKIIRKVIKKLNKMDKKAGKIIIGAYDYIAFSPM